MTTRTTTCTARPPRSRDRRTASKARGILRLLVLAAILAVTTGCMRGCTSPRPPIHLNPNMDQQPKYRPQSSSDFFYDGATMRQPVPGTIARGELDATDAFHTGKSESGDFVAGNPLEVDESVLLRGEERYNIYCAPCHSERGDGKGVLWERSQIESADLREERLVTMPDGQIFDTVTNGLGLMSGYKYPIPPRDRWAIIAWVRHLQEEAGS